MAGESQQQGPNQDYCRLLNGCIFFNERMTRMPSTTELLKLNYCRGEYIKCARYMVCMALGRDKVPADLFPNELVRAMELIRDLSG